MPNFRVSRLSGRSKWYNQYPDKPDWDKLRAPIVQGKRCPTCKREITKANPMTFSHILSKSKGGRDTRLNGKGECLQCNLRRANRKPSNSFRGR